MSVVRIYGVSDDLVYLEVGEQTIELPEPASFMFYAANKTLHAEVKFDGRRGWQISTWIDDEKEDGDLPFVVLLKQERYSPALVVVNEPGIDYMLFWQYDEKVMRSKEIHA